MGLKAVGFDIDGTLYPERQAQRRSVFFLLSHLGVVYAFSRTRRIMRAEGRDSETDELRIFAQKLRCDIDEAKSIRDNIVYKEWEGCFRRVPIYPGVREALLRLKDAGLKLAVLSDFPVGRKLEYFGLADIFDAALGFPESGRLKPHSKPFLKMAKRLCADPADIIYIGNKLAYDVRGAENSGMRGALIGTSGRGIPADVTVYPDYRQMADRILAEVVI